MMTDKDILEKIQKSLKNPEAQPSRHITENILMRIEHKSFIQDILQNIKPLISTVFKPVVFAPVLSLLLIGLFFTVYSHRQPAAVTFILENPQAANVRVAGDFNDWNPAGYRLSKDNGQWKLNLNLEPGTYQYVFVIDDSRWVLDPHNDNTIVDDEGYVSSVIEVGTSLQI